MGLLQPETPWLQVVVGLGKPDGWAVCEAKNTCVSKTCESKTVLLVDYYKPEQSTSDPQAKYGPQSNHITTSGLPSIGKCGGGELWLPFPTAKLPCLLLQHSQIRARPCFLFSMLPGWSQSIPPSPLTQLNQGQAMLPDLHAARLGLGHAPFSALHGAGLSQAASPPPCAQPDEVPPRPSQVPDQDHRSHPAHG